MTPPWVRRRRRVLLATLLPALLCLLLALKLLSLPLLTGGAADDHAKGDGAGVRTAGERLGVGNVVERWRAPYVEGTGRAMSGDLDGGRSLLEAALSRTSRPEDDCTVRTNLVLTVERLAGAAGESGDAAVEKQLAEEALALIEEGPEGCLDGSDDGNGGAAGERQREAQQRLQEKTQGGDDSKDEEQPAEPDQPEEQTPAEDPEAQRRSEELQRRNEAGQAEAESQQNLDEARRSHDGRYAEKPW